jgi:hypothetical protein
LYFTYTSAHALHFRRISFPSDVPLQSGIKIEMEVVENQILSSEIKSMTYLQDGKLDKMPV